MRRRLTLAIPLLVLVHLLGYGYALLARRIQDEQSPFRAPAGASIPAEIVAHVDAVLHGEFGALPQNQGAVLDVVVAALGRSMLVLLPAFVVAVTAGILLGLAAARHNPSRISGWLLPFATLLLATPSFYIGVLLIVLLVMLAFDVVPVQGSWLWPALVLALRPAAQIAQFSANLIVAESDKQYIVAARGIGHSFSSARRAHIFPNVAALVVNGLAGVFRLLAAELVIVEWLFNWPGIGRLLGMVLIVPRRTDAAALLFLHPELAAMIFTALALLFVIADLATHVATNAADPRLHKVTESDVQRKVRPI